jgi:hypothetical protein
MLAFRSEAHVDRWCEQRHITRGESFSLEQAWRLGKLWYEDKLSPEWTRATPRQAESSFSSLGLTSDFWRLS